MEIENTKPGRLERAIGRWSLAALMLNTMIGASAFGLPSLLVAHLGKLSPLAYWLAAAGVGTVAATLAEVSSQFRATGGRTCMLEQLSGVSLEFRSAGSCGFRGSQRPLLLQISSCLT